MSRKEVGRWKYPFCAGRSSDTLQRREPNITWAEANVSHTIISDAAEIWMASEVLNTAKPKDILKKHITVTPFEFSYQLCYIPDCQQ